MKTAFHQSLTEERWQRFSLLEQVANIGSEVERALAAQKKKNKEQSEAALFRALELFDLTLADPKNKTRLREVTRARECFLDFFLGENQYGFTAEFFQKYFLDFALAARNQR